MAVVVSPTDRNHRHAWAQLRERVGEALVLGAVVRDLQHLDRREPQAAGDVRLRIGRQQDVGGAVRGKQHDRPLVRVLGRHARPVRPQDAEDQTAEPKHLACARHDDRRTGCAGHFQRGAGVLALDGEPGLQHRLDAKPLEHVTGAADVVSLRMGEHQRGEAVEPSSAQPRSHFALRRTLVDEHRPLRHFDEGRVALADVHEGDSKPRRRRPARLRPEPPPACGQNGDEREQAQERGAAPTLRQAREPDGPRREHEGSRHGERRRGLGVRPARDLAGAPGDPGGAPAGEPGERGRGRRRDGLDDRREQAETEQRRHCGLRERVGGHRPDRDDPELEQEHGRGGRAAGGGDADDLQEAPWKRVAGVQPAQSRHHDEDRGNGRERELKARLVQ
jgi:hypothetical protein